MNVGLDGIQNNSIMKFLLFCFLALVFWDFISSSPMEEEEEDLSHYQHLDPELPPSSTFIFSLFSEMSLVFFASLSLAVLNHWDDVHGYISRSLPRSWALRFREFTRSIGINPRNSSGLGPASPEALASLESIVISDNTQGDCSICLDAFKLNDNAKKLHCKHVFHTSCLMPWLNQRSSCPVCRASVETFEQEESRNENQNSSRTNTSSNSQAGVQNGPHAVWNALRSVLDPLGTLSNHLPRVEDREALMALSIRELRERAAARSISLTGIIEKNEIVDLLLQSRSSPRS
jgi:hypothetical protein